MKTKGQLAQPFDTLVETKLVTTVKPGVFHCDSGLRVQVVDITEDNKDMWVRLGDSDNQEINVDKHTAAILSDFFFQITNSLTEK